jgi:hypothetical protein
MVVYFNIIVKNILKTKWKIISTEKIKKLVQNVLLENYNDQKTYKTIYYLKNRWYLTSLKKDIFFVSSPDVKLDIDFLIDKFYWQILKQHCKKYLKDDRYIWWLKALELNTWNLLVSDDIDIVNWYKQSKEVILWDKYWNFKTYKSKNKTLFNTLKKLVNKSKIWKHTFITANLELSILESLYNPDILTKKYTEELIKKLLKKNKRTFNFENIEKIIKLWKHHSSLNRLYNLSKFIDEKLSDQFLKILKKYSFIIDVS